MRIESCCDSAKAGSAEDACIAQAANCTSSRAPLIICAQNDAILHTSEWPPVQIRLKLTQHSPEHQLFVLKRPANSSAK